MKKFRGMDWLKGRKYGNIYWVDHVISPLCGPMYFYRYSKTILVVLMYLKLQLWAESSGGIPYCVTVFAIVSILCWILGRKFVSNFVSRTDRQTYRVVPRCDSALTQKLKQNSYEKKSHAYPDVWLYSQCGFNYLMTFNCHSSSFVQGVCDNHHND